MRRTLALTAATMTALLSLTACDAAEDAVKDAAGDAACSVAGQAADEAGRQASRAVDDIGADPQAAERELAAVRDALATAARGVDGDLKRHLDDARAAVERLQGQAEDAVAGAEVDTTAVQDAQDDLDTAVEDVKNLC
ncbi:MAG: hypothetical protein JWN84_4333 [Nocardioides sp.]|nr:hypothetical protein [Nocardioides sp.]